MPDLEQLKQKYQPVIAAIQKEGGQLQNVNLDGNQLYLKATVNSEEAKNHVWDAIKTVDPSYADLKHDIEVRATAGDATAKKANQTYTVQPGDNLSKISKQFYGDANKYAVIAKANNLENPDKIKAGQQLIIPAA
jgi:nucleoid-associated protein YgaU